MKRWIACGLAAGWVAGGMAAEPLPAPVSVYPPTPAELPVIAPAATPVATQTPAAQPEPAKKPLVPAPAVEQPKIPPAGTPDVTKPLSSVLDTPPAGTPLVAATPALMPPNAAACGCAACTTEPASGWRIPKLNLGLGSSETVGKVKAYFCWSAGPRVIPALTPSPYQPPLRHYFTGAPVPATNMGAPCTDQKAPFFGPKNLNTLPCNNGGCVGGQAGGSAGGSPSGGSTNGGSTSGVSTSGGWTAGRAAGAVGTRVGGCPDGSCGRGGRCDGCYESTLEKALGHLCPRQFGRKQPNCWNAAGVPQVSACAAGGCDGATAAAVGAVPVGGGIYPGISGGSRFASPVFVPPAPAVYASGNNAANGGGLMSTGTGSVGAVGGNVGAVGTGTPGASGGTGTTGTGTGTPGTGAGTPGTGTGGAGASGGSPGK